MNIELTSYCKAPNVGLEVVAVILLHHWGSERKEESSRRDVNRELLPNSF